MFAVDHPFEDVADGAAWFDTVAIDEADRARIARGNAQALLGVPAGQSLAAES
jgi:2,3-dihydroxybenzoate decarboxylase